MRTTERGLLARSIVAGAVVAAASIGVAGCAAVPDSNGSVGTTSSASSATTKQIDVAVANAASGSRIAAWYRQTGPAISSVERAVSDAQRAVRRPGHRGLHEACRTLQTRVERVLTAPSAPDHVARHAVAREMADLTVGADHCVDNELLAAGRSTNQAHRWSRIADDRILYVLRHSA